MLIDLENIASQKAIVMLVVFTIANYTSSRALSYSSDRDELIKRFGKANIWSGLWRYPQSIIMSSFIASIVFFDISYYLLLVSVAYLKQNVFVTFGSIVLVTLSIIATLNIHNTFIVRYDNLPIIELYNNDTLYKAIQSIDCFPTGIIPGHKKYTISVVTEGTPEGTPKDTPKDNFTLFIQLEPQLFIGFNSNNCLFFKPHEPEICESSENKLTLESVCHIDDDVLKKYKFKYYFPHDKSENTHTCIEKNIKVEIVEVDEVLDKHINNQVSLLCAPGFTMLTAVVVMAYFQNRIMNNTHVRVLLFNSVGICVLGHLCLQGIMICYPEYAVNEAVNDSLKHIGWLPWFLFPIAGGKININVNSFSTKDEICYAGSIQPEVLFSLSFQAIVFMFIPILMFVYIQNDLRTSIEYMRSFIQIFTIITATFLYTIWAAIILSGIKGIGDGTLKPLKYGVMGFMTVLIVTFHCNFIEQLETSITIDFIMFFVTAIGLWMVFNDVINNRQSLTKKRGLYYLCIFIVPIYNYGCIAANNFYGIPLPKNIIFSASHVISLSCLGIFALFYSRVVTSSPLIYKISQK